MEVIESASTATRHENGHNYHGISLGEILPLQALSKLAGRVSRNFMSASDVYKRDVLAKEELYDRTVRAASLIRSAGITGGLINFPGSSENLGLDEELPEADIVHTSPNIADVWRLRRSGYFANRISRNDNGLAEGADATVLISSGLNDIEQLDGATRTGGIVIADNFDFAASRIARIEGYKPHSYMLPGQDRIVEIGFDMTLPGPVNDNNVCGYTGPRMRDTVFAFERI